MEQANALREIVYKKSNYPQGNFDMFHTGDVGNSTNLPHLTSISKSKLKFKNINTVRNSMMMETDPIYPTGT